MRRFAIPLFCVFLAACAEVGIVEDTSVALGERQAFRAASRAATTASWGLFLNEFPQTSLREKAVQGMADAAWKEAQAVGTAAAFLSFLRAHPQHPMAGQARERAKAELEQGRGSEPEYLTYFDLFADDAANPGLRKELEKVRAGRAQSSGDKDALELVLLQYPGSSGVAPLRTSFERAEYDEVEKIGTSLAFRYFSERFPRSPLGEKARARIQAPLEVVRGDAKDLSKTLEGLRQAIPGLARRECMLRLSELISKEPELYSSQAEGLRTELNSAFYSEDGGSPRCATPKGGVAKGRRALIANAVAGLGRLGQIRQGLGALVDEPQKIQRQADEIAENAQRILEDAEGVELEMEALYGAEFIAPPKPGDTASKNAREAVRRARRASQLASGLSEHGETQSLVQLIDRQSGLLVRVISDLGSTGAGR